MRSARWAVWRGLLGDRQANDEGRALPHDAHAGQSASKLRDDAVADGQPQAGPLSQWLGGVKRVEDPRQVLWGDPGPVVTDTDLHPWPPLLRNEGGADRERATPVGLRHRLTGIRKEIQESLGQVLGIGQDRGEGRVELGSHRYLTHGEVIGHQAEGLLDQIVHEAERAAGLGTARDSQDTLEFSALAGVHPMIEKYPLNRVADAYEQMHSGKVRFRVVLTMKE